MTNALTWQLKSVAEKKTFILIVLTGWEEEGKKEDSDIYDVILKGLVSNLQ